MWCLTSSQQHHLILSVFDNMPSPHNDGAAADSCCYTDSRVLLYALMLNMTLTLCNSTLCLWDINKWWWELVMCRLTVSWNLILMSDFSLQRSCWSELKCSECDFLIDHEYIQRKLSGLYLSQHDASALHNEVNGQQQLEKRVAYLCYLCWRLELWLNK